ncbi:hypothetical protein [Aquabacterium sp.]|uniref:hypothetical protein n=1 Tax=Aquabacterium sp. TaxID=1872578 RepID=UPI0037834325
MFARQLVRLLALSAVLLASCGGGRDAGTPAPGAAPRQTLQAPRTAVVPVTACQLGTSNQPSLVTHRMVDGECLRSFTGFDKQLVTADLRRRVQAAALTPRLPTVTELFDWAEKAYPQYFPSHQANRTLTPYTYRYYPETQNHTAVDGTKVYVQGPISDGSLLYVGEISAFACLVFPESCGPAPKPCDPVASWAASGNTCTPNPDQTAQIPSGGSFTFVDSVGDTRGSATYSCSDGTLSPKGAAICDKRAPLACDTSNLRWTVASNSCVANPGEPTQLASGSVHTFLASGDRVGSISYACNDGALTTTAVPVCDLPAPVVCKPTTVSWTMDGNTCVADEVPAQINGGGTFNFLDSQGVPTGVATFSCTGGGLVLVPGSAQCLGIPHVQDSFGGDGGGADGSASGDGTAGDGAPIANALVQITDMNGKSVSATTNSIGYFRVKLTGFVSPMVITVTRPDGKVRRSLTTLSPKPNAYIFMAVTGLTDKIASDVANAAGFPGAASLTPQMVAANPNAIAASINAIRNDGTLHELIVNAGLNPSTFDPLGMPFRADGTGYDQVLDNIVVTTDASGATVIQPITCQAPTSWTVGGNTCTPDPGEETTIASGTSIVHRDTMYPTVGSVGWSCERGVVQPPILPSCQNQGTGPSGGAR